METIEVRVEGFDFEEVASHLAQLSKDERITIQVKQPSSGSSGLALDSETIILTASFINLLAVVIKVLSDYLRKTGTEGGKSSRKLLVLKAGSRNIRIPWDKPFKEFEFDDYTGQNGEKRMTLHIVNIED
jgi:hypothetical protein